MKIHKSYIAVGMIIAFTLFFELAAHADEQDQETEITFSQAIQVPGQILPAGTYLFKLTNTDVDLNIVQIFSADRTHLYATLETVPTESRQVPDNTAVALAQQGAAKPDVLLKWFYPGRNTGNEFVYSEQEEKALAQDTQLTIVTNQHTAPNSEAFGAGN